MVQADKGMGSSTQGILTVVSALSWLCQGTLREHLAGNSVSCSLHCRAVVILLVARKSRDTWQDFSVWASHSEPGALDCWEPVSGLHMGRNTLELIEGALGMHTSLGLETYFLFFFFK